MTDPKRDPDHKQPSIPEPGAEAEPAFGEAGSPAPTVVDAPERRDEL